MLTENNILVLKEVTTKPENETLLSPRFASRRTQFSFGRFILLNPKIWKNKETERISYQLLLERIRLKHILGFEVYLLKKKIDEEAIHQLTTHIESTADKDKVLELEEKLNELKR